MCFTVLLHDIFMLELALSANKYCTSILKDPKIGRVISSSEIQINKGMARLPCIANLQSGIHKTHKGNIFIKIALCLIQLAWLCNFVLKSLKC